MSCIHVVFTKNEQNEIQIRGAFTSNIEGFNHYKTHVNCGMNSRMIPLIVNDDPIEKRLDIWQQGNPEKSQIPVFQTPKKPKRLIYLLMGQETNNENAPFVVSIRTSEKEAKREKQKNQSADLAICVYTLIQNDPTEIKLIDIHKKDDTTYTYIAQLKDGLRAVFYYDGICDENLLERPEFQSKDGAHYKLDLSGDWSYANDPEDDSFYLVPKTDMETLIIQTQDSDILRTPITVCTKTMTTK